MSPIAVHVNFISFSLMRRTDGFNFADEMDIRVHHGSAPNRFAQIKFAIHSLAVIGNTSQFW